MFSRIYLERERKKGGETQRQRLLEKGKGEGEKYGIAVQGEEKTDR